VVVQVPAQGGSLLPFLGVITFFSALFVITGNFLIRKECKEVM
jgi:hypothetical protein